jgi:flagellar capping protein FliD
MSSEGDELTRLRTKQDELNRKLNEKISTDLSKFQQATTDILKQQRINQRKYLIEKIKEEQEQAEADIQTGNLMSAMAHKLTAEWYSSMLEHHLHMTGV